MTRLHRNCQYNMRIGTKVQNVVIARRDHCLTNFSLKYAECPRVLDVVNLDYMFWSMQLYKSFKPSLPHTENFVIVGEASKGDHHQI